MTSTMGGWAGKILRVDLNSGRIWSEPSLPYGSKFIGARGIAARLAWELIPPGVGALDPENVLIIGAGPLSGTSAPNSGRTTVCGLSPQAYPYEWFSRSSIGGFWGPMLKYAGFDTVVVQGASDTPVYLWIEDGKAELRDASDLWGQGILGTQRQIQDKHGPEVRTLAIGPAGENLSRIAIIGTGTGSAAGQGGFGAVMGSKKLKAIAVHGTGSVPVAHPEAYADCTRAIALAAEAPAGCPRPLKLDPEMVEKYGQTFAACGQQCSIRSCYICRAYKSVPGILHPERTYSGQIVCESGLLAGEIPDSPYDWKIGFQAGFELAQISHDLGLNHWEIGIGMVPWLKHCYREGLFQDFDGTPFDPDSPAWWERFFEGMSYRKGAMGAALSDGAVRAAETLGFGKDLIPKYYTAWGFSGHWDGRGDWANLIVFPYWLVTAIQWAVDTRDPMASGHGYAQNIMMWSPMRSPGDGLDWEVLADVGAKVYGSRDAVHPLSGYKDKAFPAFFHGQRSVMKDSLTVDDQVYPRIYSKHTEDHLARAGGMEGPTFEYNMFRLVTGMELSEVEFEQMAERVFNMERALQVRNWGRSRQVDEEVIPYFEQIENWANPFLESGRGLDRAEFAKLFDEYLTLRGWDTATGRPTRARLELLDLKDVADDLEARGLLPG
ncbi:MAG: aldehyde ferredoxin oxidoreductase N-terminal domain-containing protein [Anaerolineae bacterium]